VKHWELWKRAAEHGGRGLDAGQLESLDRYLGWLRREAIPAGALGPGEEGRLAARHIGDSLLFASPLPTEVAEIWDLGSGAGLPGIPLALLMPQTRVVLVERSGGRAQLLRRVLRILGLENTEVRETDINTLDGRAQVLVSRGVLPAEKAGDMARRLLQPGGMAVWGGSWMAEPSAPGWETVEIPEDVLDHRVWLLIMRPQ